MIDNDFRLKFTALDHCLMDFVSLDQVRDFRYRNQSSHEPSSEKIKHDVVGCAIPVECFRGFLPQNVPADFVVA